MTDRQQNLSVKKKSNRGNTLEIHFAYPEENSEQTMNEITTGLSYCGLFQGIPKNGNPTKD